ncbi:MAG: hypothetical protein KAT05_09150 [Spirochaetes bacterium]|nr:hypothetical protein [Spirochaetota bacterium]
MQSQKFNHMGIIYEFKWDKQKQVLKTMPEKLKRKISRFFDKIYNKKIPHELFEDQSIERCSNFRIVGLKRGSGKRISQNLIENLHIGHFQLVDAIDPIFPDYFYDLCREATDLYEEYQNQDSFHQKPSHDEVLTQILLKNDQAFAIETPVWTSRQMNLDSYIQKEDDLHFNFFRSITGHVDLLMFDDTDNSLVVVDYKPEGYFLRSIPQVAIYGLLLKRILRLTHIKCISFSKDEGWIYDPEILRTEIEKHIKLNGNPSLKWRKIVQRL